MYIFNMTQIKLVGLPREISGKEFTCQTEDGSLIPGSGRSPGGGNGNLFQYYFLENSMGRGAWQTTAHGLQRVRHD